MVEAEDEDVLLEAELMPEVSGEDCEADSQNCRGRRCQRSWGAGAQLAASSLPPCPPPCVDTGGGEGRGRPSVTFFSWPSGDSGTKLMLISSTSELEEPAECTLRASAMSPLLR